MSNPPVNVLVVDDDRAIQRLLADLLTQQGFGVTLERDGEWALKTFEAKPFDLVLLDLLLPGINGYEVARKLRESAKGRAVPIVMISGVYKNALHRKEAIERYGASAFIEKPFKLQSLTDALHQALGEKFPAPPEAPAPSASSDETATDALAGEEAIQEGALVEKSARASGHQGIRGDFDKKPFPEVLAEIYRWKATGALLLRREKVKKIVYFREGIPQFIKSNLLSECLGRVLVKERMISEAECEESLRRMKASRRQQGTVLVEMGCISPHNLAYALNLQLRAKLFDVFFWKSGDYAFDPRASVPPEVVNLELTCAQAIYEGIRRAYDPERVAAALGDASELFVHPFEDPLYALQEVSLGEEEHELLAKVNGRRRVSELRRLGILSPLDTDRLLYAMRCAQVVSLGNTPAVGDSEGLFSVSQSGPHLIPSLPVPPPHSPLTPPPLPISGGGPRRHTVPFSGVDTGPMQMVDIQEITSRLSNHPELSGPMHRQDEDESIVRERLAGRAAALRKMDHFEVLGVPRHATEDQIAQSYLVMARENHPDRLAGSASAEIRELASQIYERIAAAHHTLKDPAEKARYLGQIASGAKPEQVGQDVGKILSAEGKFQRGEELLRQEKFTEAERLFAEAVELYPQEGEFHAYLGWARFQQSPQSPQAAETALGSLKKAIELNPKSERTYVFSGYVYKAQGKTDLAQQHFEKAVQANPGCMEALKELSILNWAARLGARR